MEQLTKNQAVATSQEAVQNQNEPQLRDENAHNDKSVHGVLIQLTKLGYDVTPFNQILKQNAKREMRLRLGKVTVADVLAAQPVTTNLLKFMRASIKMIGVSNLQSATDRSRARRCVEACVYGTLDFVGYPRFPAPVEFIAAVIAYYVHPVNIQTACLIM